LNIGRGSAFSDRETGFIQGQILAGKSVASIARELGRSEAGVRQLVRCLQVGGKASNIENCRAKSKLSERDGRAIKFIASNKYITCKKSSIS